MNLSERLKELSEKGHMETLSTVMFLNLETIIRALQLAEQDAKRTESI